MVQEVSKIGNLRPFRLCKLDGQKLQISLGNHAYWIQHTRIMLKSLVPNFYPKMLLTFTFFRNPARLISFLFLFFNFFVFLQNISEYEMPLHHYIQVGTSPECSLVIIIIIFLLSSLLLLSLLSLLLLL